MPRKRHKPEEIVAKLRQVGATATVGSPLCCGKQVAGEPEAGRADLATGGAEGAEKTAEERPALAQ